MTNITDEHGRAFQALTSGDCTNFALFPSSSTANRAPAIGAVNEGPPAGESGEPEYEIRPLFVSLTTGMTLTDHEGRAA